MREATTKRRDERYQAEFLEFLESVGRRVAYLRQRAGLTQQDAAEAAGMHLTGWQKIESGETNATLLTLYQAAQTLEAEVWQMTKPKAGTNQPRRPGRPRRKKR